MKLKSQQEFKKHLSSYLTGEMDETGRRKFIEAIGENRDWQLEFQKMIILDGNLKTGYGVTTAEESRTSIRLLKLLTFNRPLMAALSAAAMLLFALLFNLPGSDPSPARATVALGECSGPTEKISKSNSVVSTGFKSGNDSLCDLSFPGGRDFRLRLYPESEIRFVRTARAVQIELLKGSLAGETGNHNRPEQIFLTIAEHQFELLGTKIHAEKSDHGLSLSVIEGEVAAQPLTKTSSTDEFEDKPTLITPGEIAQIQSRKITVSKLSQDESSQLSGEFTLLKKTWQNGSASGSHTKPDLQQTKLLQTQLKQFNQRHYPYQIILKAGESIYGSQIYHQNEFLVIERGESKLRIKTEQVSEIKQK